MNGLASPPDCTQSTLETTELNYALLSVNDFEKVFPGSFK